MHYAILFSLCVVAASPAAPAPAIEVEAAARAFRIESYNRCREDRERYQQLRDADDDLRVGLAATKEQDLAGREEQATAWYLDATAAIHEDRDIPASPVWLPEALADAAAGKLRDKPKTLAVKNTPARSEFSANKLPPSLAPAKQSESTEQKTETPFFFVNAALKAIGAVEPTSPKIDEVKQPEIYPAGPIVDGRIEEPVTAPAKGSRLPTAESQGEPLTEPAAIEPTLELPTLELPTLDANADETAPVETPAIELPELSTN